MDQARFHCQVCHRQPTAQLEFFCCTCARGTIYNTRVHGIQALLDRERLASEVARALTTNTGTSSSTEDGRAEASDAAARNSRIAQGSAQQQQQSEELARSFTETCTEIKRDIKALKASIVQQRNDLARRKAKGSASKRTAASQAAKAVQIRQESAQAIEADGSKLHSAISDDRILLCREVASLYGLELRKRKRDAGSKDMYMLGGEPIIDLRDLNSASPTAITVSANRVAHLLHLTSHYLSLQLPAQTDLPSPSSPYTVIHTPSTSYKEPTLPHGRKGSTSSSVKTSRQRTLHIDKPLSTLASDDPVAYSLFVDAMSLLAWNVAWLAKTQGLDIGGKHWDEVCAMGRNLWLLFGPQSALRDRPPNTRQPTPSDPNPHQPLTSSPMARTPSGTKRAQAQLAIHPAAAASASDAAPRFSHDSARAFLPAAAAVGGAAEVFRSWHFASYVRLIERIKSALANDRAGAEWEMLEKEEWAEAREALMAEDAQGAKAEDGAAASSARDESGAERKGDEQGGGGKGWMRLRNRTGSLL